MGVWVVGLVVLIAIGGMCWVRLAPADPAKWHVDPMVSADQDLAGGVRRLIPADKTTFDTLHRLILSTPRTEVLAGDTNSGRITYVTRSKAVGYPDYATVQFSGSSIEIWSRQRFGRSDLGVNKSRVDTWLKTLGQGG